MMGDNRSSCQEPITCAAHRAPRELARIDMRGTLVDGGAPQLSVQCDGKVGLTRDEVQRVDDWLTALDDNRRKHGAGS